MAKNGQDVVYEGWLTKSPPTKRIWRARWRRRWFSLTHSGELPGQFILTYYTDRNCRKLKGVIDLDHCEQVDLGLKLEERKLKFDHVFDIKTPTRTYYLAADTETEMKSWVNCICKVCGLKSTNEEDDLHISRNSVADIEIVEEIEDQQYIFEETPPISPVSTSPYIPISECITGKSPILDPKDFKTLLEYNIKNSFLKSHQNHSHANETYELPPRNYINCNDTLDPRFYDCPRQLAPPHNLSKIDTTGGKTNDKNSSSPLQSPTDSESVFTDDDWVHNTSDTSIQRANRPSNSSGDVELIASQKFTKASNKDAEKISDDKLSAPPRPPKPSHRIPAPCYLNLSSIKHEKDSNETDQLKTSSQDCPRVITDDMYDFPRSHQMETDTLRGSLMRRHCYNNAAPVNIEGTIFRYDISPKPSTSTSQIFKYDFDESQDEPASPLSQTSSTAAYSNLPSPMLAENHLMPPPTVNRELKPKRKLSDTHSLCSNPEPPSPRSAPSVDRKLKPPTPLQEVHMRKQFKEEDDTSSRKIRAAPSPTPPSTSSTNLGRSHESLLLQNTDEQIYHYLSGKMQYLDLDLDGVNSSANVANNSNGAKTLPAKSSAGDTVYKKVDFMKTHAFNITRNNLEKERQEPVMTFVKK